MHQVLSHFGALGSISEVIDGYKSRKILLLTGKASFELCGAAQTLMPQLYGYEVRQFSDLAINPKVEDAVKGADVARDFQPDLILAVGGGSVLDIAKLVKALLATPGDPAKIMKGKVPLVDPGVPLIAVPTTAGSGSEATHFAVVYIGHDKFSLADQSLLPGSVVLDGALIASGSAYQKTCNGLDALAQGIEGSWACGATPESRAIALKAVNLAASHLSRIVTGKATDDELQIMIEAANLAGQGIDCSKTTAPHAWSYGITSHYGIPHEHAVWMTLPKIFQMHATAKHDRVLHPDGPKGLNEIMTNLSNTLSIADVGNATETLTIFLKELGVETDLSAIGADTIDRRKFLSDQVNTERLYNNPVSFDGPDIATLFGL